MPNPMLSICIPTYNRSECLKMNLPAIFKAAENHKEQVEIRVSDNNSPDSTQQILAELKKEYPSLIYSKNETNIGAERNNAKLAKEAQGDFVWIIGDDDKVFPTSVALILNRIAKSSNCIVLNYTDIFYGSETKLETSHYSHNDMVILDANRCMETFIFDVSFISSLIMPREWWCKYYESFLDTGFAHMGALYKGLRDSCHLAFIKEPQILHEIGRKSDYGNFTFEYYVIEGVGSLLRSFRNMGYSRKSVSKLANHAIYWPVNMYSHLTFFRKLRHFPFFRLFKQYGAYRNYWWLVFIEQFFPARFCQFIRKARKRFLSHKGK